MHIIFIHGTGGDSHDPFFDWCRAELEKLGHRTSAPDLPSTNVPDRSGWIDEVNRLVRAGEPLVLVGRSLGGSLIPYLLEQEGFEALAAFSIAAPITDLGWSNLKEFFEEEPDWERAKRAVQHYYHWYSDDDPFVPLAHGEAFQAKLGGEFRVFPAYSHFYNEEFPELVDSIKKLGKGV